MGSQGKKRSKVEVKDSSSSEEEESPKQTKLKKSKKHKKDNEVKEKDIVPACQKPQERNKKKGRRIIFKQ